jgi:hypothetical protein
MLIRTLEHKSTRGTYERPETDAADCVPDLDRLVAGARGDEGDRHLVELGHPWRGIFLNRHEYDFSGG